MLNTLVTRLKRLHPLLQTHFYTSVVTMFGMVQGRNSRTCGIVTRWTSRELKTSVVMRDRTRPTGTRTVVQTSMPPKLFYKVLLPNVWTKPLKFVNAALLRRDRPKKSRQSVQNTGTTTLNRKIIMHGR